MKAWKNGAVIGMVWGFISWFGLEVAMSNFYLPLSSFKFGVIWRNAFRELVKITLFLPALITVKILRISPERDPVSMAFQNIGLFPVVLLMGIILGAIFYPSFLWVYGKINLKRGKPD